jgi:hypothetical protein
MFGNQGFVGVQRCTTAGGQAVGISGKPTRVYHVSILSGAIAGQIKLYNGTSTSGTVYVQQLCTVVNTSNEFDYGQEGFLFPNGCYYEEVVDANVKSTTIMFSQEV